MTSEQDGTEANRRTAKERLLYRICPHWSWDDPHLIESVMMDVVEQNRCGLCGKRRVHARIPEPHPSRDKQQVIDNLQRPGYEVIVEEWKPYGETVP